MKVDNKVLAKLLPKGSTVAELAKELKAATAAKQKYEKLAEQQKSLAHLIAVTRLPKLMEDMEGDGINVPGVGYAELVIEIYPYVKVEDQERFYAWLRKNDMGDLIKETIHPQTLKAWAGDMVDDPEQAGSLPEYLTVGKVPTVKLRAEKKKRK